MTVIALDLGTTGIRAIAFDSELTLVAQSYEECPQTYPHSGWVEQDALQIWDITKRLLKSVLAQVGDVKAIGITNQRETTIVWDKHSGQPLHPAISWQCRRTAERCSQIAPDLREQFRKKTGLRVDAYFSASKLEWIFKTLPDAHEKAQKGDVLFGTVDTWILWNLTGGRVHATDVSNASRTLLFDIHKLSFDETLCAFWGVPKACLPEVKASDALFGTLSSDFGWEIPIHAILGDQQASLFAQCGDKPGTLKNTYGTGLFVMAATGNTPIDTPKLITTVAWQRNKKTTYALEGSMFTGGSLIQWLRDDLGLITSASETEDLAKQADPSDSLFLVPALNGLGAPYWDSSARGLLIGFHRGTNKAQIVRAALESLAYQSADVISEMGKNYHILKVDGGASENAFLMQFQADILQMTVEKTSITESTAVGVAGLAGLSVGFWTETQFRQKIHIEKKYTPSKETSYSLSKWHEAVKRSQEWE